MSKQKPQWQLVKIDKEGNNYITSYGRKYLLDGFIRCNSSNYPNQAIEVHGIYSTGYNSLGIQLSDDGEYAKVAWIENENN